MPQEDGCMPQEDEKRRKNEKTQKTEKKRDFIRFAMLSCAYVKLRNAIYSNVSRRFHVLFSICNFARFRMFSAVFVVAFMCICAYNDIVKRNRTTDAGRR